MSEYQVGTEMTDAQKLEFLRALLTNMSQAMFDIREGVERLCEESRRVTAIKNRVAY